MSVETPSLEDKLEAARTAKAEREAKRKAIDDARELLVLELEARFDEELGLREQAYQILEFVQLDKVFAVKRPSSQVTKTFEKTYRGTRESTFDEKLTYVRDCLLYPEWDADAQKWIREHPASIHEFLVELKKLEGARLSERQGKI
jgi:hypothetical protein